MKCDLIIMGDLPEWKKYEVWPDGKNMMKCGLIVMGDLPEWKKYEKKSYYDGRPTQMETI